MARRRPPGPGHDHGHRLTGGICRASDDMTRTIWPYIRPRSGIETGAWQIRVPDGVEPLPAELPHWDYNTDLHLTRSVTLDVDTILPQCGLADDARLGVAAV